MLLVATVCASGCRDGGSDEVADARAIDAATVLLLHGVVKDRASECADAAEGSACCWLGTGAPLCATTNNIGGFSINSAPVHERGRLQILQDGYENYVTFETGDEDLELLSYCPILKPVGEGWYEDVGMTWSEAKAVLSVQVLRETISGWVPAVGATATITSLDGAGPYYPMDGDLTTLDLDAEGATSASTAVFLDLAPDPVTLAVTLEGHVCERHWYGDGLLGEITLTANAINEVMVKCVAAE